MIQGNKMKILIGTPIHETRDYAVERWLASVAQLTNQTPTDLLLVDSSPGLDYVETVRGYCDKLGLKNYKIKHIDVHQPNGMDEMVGRSREVIRQEVLTNGYDAWFSWECDQIIPPDTLSKLAKLMEAGNYTLIHPNTWARDMPAEPEAGFGCCLISRQPLEKYGFLLEYPDMPNSWYKGEAWFKKQVLEGGGNYIEIYGVIEPIKRLVAPA